MSTPTTLQGKLIPFAISTNGSTYKNVVCKKATSLNVDNSVNKEQTDCGTFSALGSVQWSFDFEGILNTTPAGATEVSANEMLGYANDQTLVYVKMLYSTTIYRQGQGYITNYKETYNTNGLVGFTATFTGDGTLDITL